MGVASQKPEQHLQAQLLHFFFFFRQITDDLVFVSSSHPQQDGSQYNQAISGHIWNFLWWSRILAQNIHLSNTLFSFLQDRSCCSWSGGSGGSYESSGELEIMRLFFRFSLCGACAQILSAAICGAQRHCQKKMRGFIGEIIIFSTFMRLCFGFQSARARDSICLSWFCICHFSSCISVFCISHLQMRCARACRTLDSWGSGFGTPFVAAADPRESMAPPASLITCNHFGIMIFPTKCFGSKCTYSIVYNFDIIRRVSVQELHYVNTIGMCLSYLTENKI